MKEAPDTIVVGSDNCAQLPHERIRVLGGIYSLALLSRLDPPERSSSGFPDGQAAVQQHGAQSPHGIPLQEPRDGVSLLHHPGNAGTRKLPHVRTGTLQLQET